MTTTSRNASDRPCYKLSVELLATYKRINELFYEAKRKHKTDPKKQSYNDGYDDSEGNYVVQNGEEIAGRYIVQDTLGKGSFGVVVKAHDHRREECVAIKIIKNKVQFFHQARVEIEILTLLNAQASEEHNVVKLKKVFSWKEHLCLVFEILSFNLYDLLKYTKFAGVSLNLIRKFANQLLKTLDFLSQPHMGIIHCDLKPENILLRNPKRSAVKVIDFGSSCFASKKMFKYIQSRFYRSPEVILGLSYDCAIDMWSLACILVEMHTGQPLFDGKDESEQLLKFAAILGPVPHRFIEASPKKKQFYAYEPKQKQYVLAPAGKDPARYPRNTLESIVGVHTGGPGGRRRDQAGHSESEYLQFVDLVKKMLVYSARDRLTPAEALKHPFLQSGSNSNEAPPTALASSSSTHRFASPMNRSSSSHRAQSAHSSRERSSEHTRSYSHSARDRRDSRTSSTSRHNQSTGSLSSPRDNSQHRGTSRDRSTSGNAEGRAVNASFGHSLNHGSSHSAHGQQLGSAQRRSHSHGHPTDSHRLHYAPQPLDRRPSKLSSPSSTDPTTFASPHKARPADTWASPAARTIPLADTIRHGGAEPMGITQVHM